MLLLLTIGCAPTPLQVGDDPGTTALGTDSGILETTAGDTGGGVPDLDYRSWTGERRWTSGDCEAVVSEDGTRLDEDWIQYDLLLSFCEDCEHWYVLDVSPGAACGLPVSTYTFRGLLLSGPDPEIYYMDEGALGGGFMATGTWAADGLAYQVSLFGVEQDGRVDFGQ